MEYVGFLINRAAEYVDGARANLAVPLPLQTVPVDSAMTLLMVIHPQAIRISSHTIDAVATTLAKEFGQCLAISRDDSIDLRTAELYGEEGFLEAFGSLDEVWVPVTDHGFVDTKGRRLTSSDVEENDDDGLRIARIFDGVDAGLLRMTGRRVYTSDSISQLVLDAPSSP